MGDLTVVLDRKNITVTLDANAIKVKRPNIAPERIPLNMVSRIIVIGNPMVSCDVWRAAAKNNVSVILLSIRGADQAAYIGSGLSATAYNRISQVKSILNAENLLMINRWLLNKKINAQNITLSKLGGNEASVQPFLRQINNCVANINKATNRAMLMGYEGVAASAYFQGIAQILPKQFKFKGRNKRPPKDPVNALLSLSYTIAYSDVLRAIQQKGLDPSIGFLHSLQPGRESLVLDILEPIRPEIDFFIFQLVNQNIISENMFTNNSQDGCRMNKKGRAVYYSAWSMWQEDSEKDITKLSKSIIENIIEIMPDPALQA